MKKLDQDKLKEYLAEKLGAEDLAITSFWQNLEGWSMDTFSIGLSYQKDGKKVDRDIIIRKAPEVGLMYENYDMSIEYRVLTGLMKTDVAAPKTFWLEEDPEVLGQPFYVMEKVEGDIPFPPAMTFDPKYRLFPDDKERESIADDFVKNLAAIHTVDWHALDLDFLGVPEQGKGSAIMEVEFWEARVVKAGLRNKPVAAYAIAWLKDNLVECDKISLVHGDYRSGNYIVKDSRIAAILDWELVHLGDPLSDIAYILGAWRSAPPNKWLSHLLPEEEFFERYEEASGIKIDRGKLDFYRMLFKLKGLALTLTAVGAFNKNLKIDLKIGTFANMQHLFTLDLVNDFQKQHKKRVGA